ncbi:pyridoxamine 5'-phosphate oxidase family protein [Streptomyces sp. McG3]|uniref:pyridoxamine 5'-phosphate oxidase family protein n=1 Tax=Streptomyces sp. McG3 TaxID=2725483 RepID=UPI001BE5F9D0|nr:pyridoxamine 5'-phosphate oxidase family protein [Streptomyces sp. McG3]MBT2898587.1 pyridoxamine 5'-phosphate oxidase family protein [Streptomyces sp. McG3]
MSGYHRGETAAQERAGLARRAASAGRAIGSDIPEVAADFLARQPFLVLGGADDRGRIWATQLTGEPGFLSVPAPDTLVVGALPPPGDPLAGLLSGAGAEGAAPARVGMIGIEPATRRRMRMNGRAVRAGDGLRVDLDQALGNCPKYIQERRHRRITPGEETGQRPTVTDGDALSPAQQEALRTADTFFIATASDRGDADASHRGGNPGFVQVLTPRLLRWPDYAGNGMFLTLGNLELNPAAGLLVPDWDTGASLHLTGTARTVWDEEAVARVPGAERLVEFEVTAVREVTAASPLRWSEPAFHRFNPPVAG